MGAKASAWVISTSVSLASSSKAIKVTTKTGTPLARPVSDLAVTYLVFPGSAEDKRSVPDLEKWHQRCTDLMAQIGVPNAPLHRWEDIVPPWPTPTPTPTPTPDPAASPAAQPSPAAPAEPEPTASPTT